MAIAPTTPPTMPPTELRDECEAGFIGLAATGRDEEDGEGAGEDEFVVAWEV